MLIMQSLKNKPTKRDISKILNRPINGWNDKRKSHNRIKITEQLTFNEMRNLENELIFMFPDYRFVVGDVLWQSYPNCKRATTAIRYWKK